MTTERMSTEEMVAVVEHTAKYTSAGADRDLEAAQMYRLAGDSKRAEQCASIGAKFRREANALTQLLSDYQRMREALQTIAQTNPQLHEENTSEGYVRYMCIGCAHLSGVARRELHREEDKRDGR